MMSEWNGTRVGGRILLALLTFYALAMIAPDVLRAFYPLGSFGMETDADGRIYNVEAQSPAGRAGLSDKDSLDLGRMTCKSVDTEVCASNLVLWGGRIYATPGRQVTLFVKASGDGQVREVRLTAEKAPLTLSLRSVLLLDWIAGILVVLGAAFLVCIRPGPMTWGFFAYAMYYNPGQWFQFYAWLQQWPRALLVQDVAACILQAAGFVGLLLFALRVPVDRVDGRWRVAERALPAAALVLLAIALMSLGSLFGYRTEFAMQWSILVGVPVSVAAFSILIARRADLSPRDYQRIRWVIWGCLIGLPAYLVAEISMETSLPLNPFGGVPEDAAYLLYFINGIICLFVVQAVRRRTVVSVWIPLRRVTLLGLLLTVPIVFIHEGLDALNESIRLPKPYWVLGAAVLIFLIYRAHDWLTEHVDRLFDRDFRLAEERLAEVGRAIQRADNLDEIERLLVEEPLGLLRLASAALFRSEDGLFRRRVSAGWSPADAAALKDCEPPLAGNLEGPFRLSTGKNADPPDAKLPSDLARPILGVPVGNSRRRIAVVLYGPHEAGTNLSDAERELLGRLAREAEVSYEQVENETLRTRILALEAEGVG
jgi:hypothetical protein